jgi:hypothetical protein
VTLPLAGLLQKVALAATLEVKKRGWQPQTRIHWYDGANIAASQAIHGDAGLVAVWARDQTGALTVARSPGKELQTQVSLLLCTPV